MTDASDPREGHAEPPHDEATVHAGNGAASESANPAAPSSVVPPLNAPERERADSITPLSSPIVALGDDEPVRSDRAPAAGSEPPAPSVRRLVPPPKPKGLESRPPVEPNRRPYFPAPGLPSTPPQPAPLARSGLPPSAGALRVVASSPAPRPSPIPEARLAASPAQNAGGPPPKTSSAPPLSRSLPPNIAFPGPRGSSRPPPTLPSGASPSRFPWLSPATAELAGSSDNAADGVGPADDGLELEEAGSDENVTRGNAPESGSPSRDPVLPPAQRSPSPKFKVPSSQPGAPRAAVLPRATRDTLRRSTTPPPKPRIVPPRPQKETPTVAIQAMRIIAIGTEDAQPAPGVGQFAGNSGAETETTSPENDRLPAFDLQPELSATDIATTDVGATDLVASHSARSPQDLPVLAEVQDIAPSPVLEDVPPLPEAALKDAPSLHTETPEPLGLELYPLPAQVAATDSTLASAGAEQSLQPIADAEVDSVRTQEPLDVLDAESQPAAPKRPPPPRRISMPSAPDESQAPVAAATAQPEPALQVVTSATVEVAPRQPPPAPSRVPREGAARPSVPERSKEPAASSTNGLAPASAAASDAVDKPKARPRRPWWEELFGEDFSRATARLNDAQIDQEVSFIEESLGVAPGGALLDLGCGTGDHAVELASRGYGIVGYDLSLYQLALAQEVAAERGQKLNFLQGDMREMAFEEVFDGMYCWNTTFGYFEEDKNVLVAERMFAALKPGGTLLLDVANRDFVAMDQPSSVWYEGDSCVCMDDMSVDSFTSRLRVKRSLILDDGRTRECHYSIRLYSLHELGRILHDIGFRVTEASGHPATPGVFLGQSSPRIIILAQKP
jgi:SAM-dependent methyltransferase